MTNHIDGTGRRMFIEVPQIKTFLGLKINERNTEYSVSMSFTVGCNVKTPYGLGTLKAIRDDGMLVIQSTCWFLANEKPPTFYMMNSPPPNTPLATVESVASSGGESPVELESVFAALGVSDAKGADDEVWEKKAAAIAAADELPPAVEVVVGDVKVDPTPSQKINTMAPPAEPEVVQGSVTVTPTPSQKVNTMDPPAPSEKKVFRFIFTRLLSLFI